MRELRGKGGRRKGVDRNNRARKNLPINAASEDGKEGSGNGTPKGPELAAPPDGLGLGISGSAGHVLPHPQPVVQSQAAKYGEHNNLQADAGNDGVVAAVEQLLVVLASRGGDAASDGLDDEARQVRGEEDARVPLGFEARERGVQGEGDVFEGEVDCGADEGWAEDDGADLELEGVLVPGVVVEEDAADVA